MAEGQAPPPLIGVAFALAGIALLALMVLLIDPLREGAGDAISGNTGQLRADIRGLGFSGALIVLLLGLVHAVVWYPAEILDAAVGFVYEFWVALPLIMLVWLANALVCYWIGRHAARPLLYRFISRARFDRLEALAERGGVPLLLGMRLVPVVPFSLFSYVAGAARVPLGAVHVDDSRRLPADHGRLRLSRQPARGAVSDRPDPLGRGRRPDPADARHPPGRADDQRAQPGRDRAGQLTSSIAATISS